MKHVFVGRKHNNTLSYVPGREWSTMAERAEKLAAHLDIERKLQFYDNWARAVINGYFVFSDGSELKVPMK